MKFEAELPGPTLIEETPQIPTKMKVFKLKLFYTPSVLK